MKVARLITYLLLLSALLRLLGFASEIHGFVTAGSPPSPIKNARVLLRANGVERSTVTDDAGSYHFVGVPENSPIVLQVEAEGLQTLTKSEIVLHPGESRALDLNMQLAGPHSSVFVAADVFEMPQQAAVVSQGISQKELLELPSVTRTVSKAAILDPHVRQAIGLGSDYQDSYRLSINAGSYRNTAYVLDGMTTYDWIYSVTPIETLSIGSTRELKVLTGQYSAQYGISTTGVLVMASNAGGSQYHAEAFTFVRPSGIQASAPLATFHIPNEREDWGASLGGPLRSSRTNFFASYEQAQQDRGAFIQSPTPGFFDGHTSEYYALLRLDHRLSSSHSLTARFNGNHLESNNVNDRISGFNQASTGRYARTQSWGGQVSEQAAFGNTLNQARFSFVDYFPDSAVPLQSSVTIVRPNYSTAGYSTSNWVHARNYSAGDLLSMQRGRHTWKAGIELNSLDAKDYSYTPLGTYTFASGAPKAGEHPLNYSQTFGTAFLSYGQTELNAFLEDSLKLTPSLTANLGLRYEFQTLTDNHANFAPRVGLAWDVRHDGKTVVKASTGLFYDQYYLYIARRFRTLGPNAPQATYTLNYGDAGFPAFPNSLSAPPSGASSGKRDLYLRANTLSNPYALQASLALEQQLAPNLTLSLTGLHSHTLKQMRVNDINHPVPFIRTGPGQYRGGTLAGAAAAANITRPYQSYDGIAVRDLAVIENTASSIYDSFDVGLTGTLAERVQLSAHYVLSNSVAYSMFYADANSGVPNEWNNLGSAERAPSDFYQRNRFVGSGSVQLPWQSRISFVAMAGSGLPVNPITGDDNNGDSYTVDRPVGFGRNSFRGPLQASFDLSAAKLWKLTPRFSLETRLESDNLFNHHNFITVNNVYGEGATPLATFLTPKSGITNADPSRQFQFASRILF